MKGYKTLTFNVLAAAVPILEMAEIRDVLPDEWLPYYTLGVVLANLALRAMTTTPIGAK